MTGLIPQNDWRIDMTQLWSEKMKEWPFYLADGLPEDVKSRLWLQAVTYVSNTTPDMKRNIGSIKFRTNREYAYYIKKWLED